MAIPVEAVVVVEVAAEEVHPQLLQLLLMAMEDQMAVSRAIPPLSSMETNPRVSNS